MLRTYLHTPIFAVGLQLYDDHTNIPSAQPTKVGQSILINFVDFVVQQNTGNLISITSDSVAWQRKWLSRTHQREESAHCWWGCYQNSRSFPNFALNCWPICYFKVDDSRLTLNFCVQELEKHEPVQIAVLVVHNKVLEKPFTNNWLWISKNLSGKKRKHNCPVISPISLVTRLATNGLWYVTSPSIYQAIS